MPAALAQRVAVLPSTAFGAGQHPPDDDAVTGLFRDSSCSAAGAAVWAAPANAAVSSTTVTVAPPARMASALPRIFMNLPPLCKPFRRVTRTIEIAQCCGASSRRVTGGVHRRKPTKAAKSTGRRPQKVQLFG